MRLIQKKSKGFTFTEVMLALMVLGVVFVLGSSSWRDYRATTDMDAVTIDVVDTLRRAQENAKTGEGFITWGVHFDNGLTQFYQLFAGAEWSGAAKYAYVSLPSSVRFESPPQASTLDILFDVHTGYRALGDTSVVLYSTANPAVKKKISVAKEGTVTLEAVK